MTLASGWYNASFFYGAGFTTGLNDDQTTSIDWNTTSPDGYSGVDVVKSMLNIAADPAFMAIADGDISNQLASGALVACVSGTWDSITAQEVFGDGYAATKLPTFTIGDKQVQQGSVAGFKFAEKVRSFTENGGTVIFTYWSGIVDDTDRCYLGGVPHNLLDVLGLRSTEIDGLYDDEENSFIPVKENALGLQKIYSCRYLCDLVQLHGASAVMTYGTDFYAGYPAVTVNSFGKGEAWYVAADADSDFYDDFLEKLVIRTKTAPVLQEVIPDGIEMTTRETENGCYYIFQNFGTTALHIPMPEGELRTVYGNPTEKLSVYGMVIVYQEK